MSEAGLVRKWDLDTSYRLQLQALREGRANLQGTSNGAVFALFEFQLSFFVWGVGVAVGVIVLISEITLGCIQGKLVLLCVNSMDDPKTFS
jgi:hypothetical protein